MGQGAGGGDRPMTEGGGVRIGKPPSGVAHTDILDCISQHQVELPSSEHRYTSFSPGHSVNTRYRTCPGVCLFTKAQSSPASW